PPTPGRAEPLTPRRPDRLCRADRGASGMTAWQGVRIAIRALRVNMLRSILTMLGIIIGVGAVIAMVAVGSGAQARVIEQIQSLGSNLINHSGLGAGADGHHRDDSAD